MANAKYKGFEIAFVEFIIKEDAYALFDLDNNLVATLKRHEYLAQPQLRTIGNSHGRHRKPSSPLHRSPVGKSSGTGPAGAFIPLGAVIAFNLTGGTLQVTFTVEPEPIPIPDAGIRAGEIIGHRCWWVNQGLLHSVYMATYQWTPGLPASGKVSAGVGVHAFKKKDEVIRYSAEVESNCNYISAFLVSGTVSMWGEIVEHQRGYRAEFAKVRSLDTDDEELKKRYGV